ncbi:MAG TPA: MmcQ/YjbR family DNA-binding protein [Blastocatellia bacterium]|nr:MmcQ/YjbR family DNA-binding protein [Blastocatellia bacterium]
MSRPKQAQSRRSRVKGVTWDVVRQFALALPGVEEGTSYSTPAFRVNGKLLARFHQDGESLVVKVEYAAREVLMGANPKTYYVTDHYRCWPLMLVRIASVDQDEIRQLLEDAWRSSASSRQVAAWDASAKKNSKSA